MQNTCTTFISIEQLKCQKDCKVKCQFHEILSYSVGFIPSVLFVLFFRYARKFGYPYLEHATLPRIGAVQTILQTLLPKLVTNGSPVNTADKEESVPSNGKVSTLYIATATVD